MLSYWEKKSFFSSENIAVIGSGIVGLSTAIHIKKLAPKQGVIVLEKGSLPSGASTKNAGFACFGSMSEILDDITSFGEEKALELVNMRWEGLDLLRTTLGDDNIGFKPWGGYELFTHSAKDEALFERCYNQINTLNKKLKFIGNEVFKLNDEKIRSFNFKQSKHLIENQYEAQIDTGKMMRSLIDLAHKSGVSIINGVTVSNIDDNAVSTNLGDFTFKQVVICTNGFARQLLPQKNVKPARAQVLITKPIENLHLKGTFHYDRGYYYFRNIDNRLLLGGGRNLDVEGETTTELKLTEQIQHKLEALLSTVILPHTPYEIDMRWAGVMGVGDTKAIILERSDNNQVCAVRLGGMGVAVGSLVGKKAAEMVLG